MNEFKVTGNRKQDFINYYALMMYIGDCDPAYPSLRYIADRHELNIQQRYWLAYLYSISYCAPTAYYMFNEFPDFENVNLERVQRWWNDKKSKLFFQTDRAKAKNFNKVPEMIKSYKEIMGQNQQNFYHKLIIEGNQAESYNKIYKETSKLFYYGRFSLFNLIQAVFELTQIPIHPTGLELKQAQSCRNGLCYALDELDMITMHHKPSKKPIDYPFLKTHLVELYDNLKEVLPELPVTYWNIQTVLCAYKKLYWNKRYLGYYIDRQQQQIITSEKNITEGINWNVLWEFREEYFPHEVLGEKQNWKGIRKPAMKWFTDDHMFNPSLPQELTYLHSVSVPTIGNIYQNKMKKESK